MPDFAVAVVICTRNRCVSLARALASIADDPSTTPAEVIVADNGSTDGTSTAVAAASAASARPLRVIWTTARGHARVRNEALRHVRADVCLFTDDDVTVEPGWIDAMARAFANPRVDAVAGRVIPRFHSSPRPRWMADEIFFRPLTLWDNGLERFRMGPGHYPIGANMAFRMARLPQDPFDPRFGHTGRAALGFDETELFDRLFGTHCILYEPAAVVNHWLDGTMSFGAVRRKMYQHGAGFQRYRNSKVPLPSYPRRVVHASRHAKAAVAARRRTRRLGLDADTAVAELRELQKAGAFVETLLAARPRLSEWIATRV
jgi:glycosyltransferase involved in cell wall biosynthesis